MLFGRIETQGIQNATWDAVIRQRARAMEANGVAYEMTQFNNGLDGLKVLPLRRHGGEPAHTGCHSSRLEHAQKRWLQCPHSAEEYSTPGGCSGRDFHQSQARSDKARSDTLGAVRYIQKPSSLDEFFTTVGQAVKEMLAA